jgi:hypothetical protein
MSGRFVKGRSGNPKGRPPKNVQQKPDNEFDVIINKTLPINQGGGSAEVTVDEALQHKLLQAAFEGNRSARREILKMIEKRDIARVERHPPTPVLAKFLMEETCTDNAVEALLLLGIVEPCTKWDGHTSDGDPHVALKAWAVQKALARNRSPISQKDKDEIFRSCADADSLKWPRDRS